MHKTVAGLAAMIALAFVNQALAESETERIQETEQPGSEIEIDMGTGGADIHRKSGKPLFGLGLDETAAEEEREPMLEPLDDPDDPIDPDPIDEELPGEGPESLSGPDDEDPLPY